MTTTVNDWQGIAATQKYFNSYSYDPNGNITNLVRKDQSGTLMDQFTYGYGTTSNRLLNVADAAGVTSNPDDIESGQVANNYQYDLLGQLISDNQEGILNYNWRLSDRKLRSITGAPTKADVNFIYNPFGQRVVKIVKPKVNGLVDKQSNWIYTYYSYDANGQVMAVYDCKLDATNATLNKATLKEQHLYGSQRLGMVNKNTNVYENNTANTAISPLVQNTYGNTNYELTNHLGNVNAVITDRRYWNTTTLKYEAVVEMKKDYYPFGMEMPGRTFNSDSYRYGYIGMEGDPEVKGQGNSYNTEFRQYDPRIGRWLTVDPKRHWFPSMSAYCYASNTPIVGKDDNGLYTIFVNGYIYGYPNYTIVTNRNKGETYEYNDDILPGKPYWSELGNGFIEAGHKYFGDGIGRFVNGTGSWAFSPAYKRQEAGKELGKKMASEIIADINRLNSDDNPNNDVKELNFVTHSMGAAFGEGMIETFMNDPMLRELLEKGQIVHFSACDADDIVISENSKNLNRSQLNYRNDKTLSDADPGSDKFGGWRIPGVKKFGTVVSSVKDLHPNANPEKYNPHFDGKAFIHSWYFLRVLDSKYKEQKSPKCIELELDDIQDYIPTDKSNPKT